ncbi:MAG TPA: trigger factor [Candidatus Copromorpha excrementigallinarum]|uniref:Trigger factor n=1 Tax=Candidatus Allocopromorpha excrementigallinarum TaxID=2840742 RepID=A0A9D1L6E7_9FIRM|nr:trigger factor [Candidatus Copromorpha excrementigallinarum]
MKSTLISKEKNIAKFTMEFTAEEFENAIIEVYKAQKNRFVIDGFRKGKAPRSIIEKKYGEGVFFEDAINNLFSLRYPLAIDELDLEVIDSPKAEFSQIKKGEGFTVTITVECYPEIEVRDYKGVETEKVSAEVTDEDVENEIKSMARRNSRMITVDRPAKEGDMVLIDYEGWIGDEQFEGGTAERQPLKLGSGTFIPGFEEQLIGVSTGEDKDVKVTFPEDYHSKDLAGKEAVFKCKVHEIKEEELPEIDDDFVKDISEFDTLDQLRADTREKLEKAAEARAESSMKNSVIEKVVESNDIDVPDAMVESEIDSMMSEFDQQLRGQGMDLASYFKYLGREPEEFRDELREEALKKVKTRMIVNGVAKQENFEVTDEEVSKEIEEMAKQYSLEADKIREMLGTQNLEMIASDIKMKKAIDFMYDNAVKK